MKVTSLIRHHSTLMPVEVELTLAPGLPQFQFIGLPDTALKESALRIRSAIREQGFRLPRAQQILVHLKPTHLKKTSLGLDLAIAAALLWETEQLPVPSGATPLLYGELSLRGEVSAPADLGEFGGESSQQNIYSGWSEELPFDAWAVRELGDLRSPTFVAKTAKKFSWQRPTPPVSSISQSAVEITALSAAGEHSLFISGPPGSGKSTLAECVASLLEAPSEEAGREIHRLQPELQWRPIRRPHHSTPALTMIGGGAAIYIGEITRAHGGVLILDELLQFSRDVQEALREPLENGEIAISRAGNARTLPARFLTLATANLCECGRYVPGRDSESCRCSRKVRNKTISRLNGPFIDRFQLVSFSHDWLHQRVPLTEVAAQVSGAIAFRQQAREQLFPNSLLDPAIIENTLSSFQRQYLIDLSGLSLRRRRSFYQVARTAADLRNDACISDADLETAYRLAVRGHRDLGEFDDL